MVAGKAEIAAALGPTLPTIDMIVTYLSHFVSQNNNLVHGIAGVGIVSGRVCRGSFGCGGYGGRGRGGGCGGGGGRGSITVAAHNYTSA